jgi:hypothetical protein
MLYSFVEQKFESKKIKSPFYGTVYPLYWGRNQTEEGVQMQTIYVTTTHFIRHEGNMVDLTEYRRKLALAQGQQETEPAREPVQEERRGAAGGRRAAQRSGLVLDWAASLALIVTALSFAAKIL